MLEREEIEPGRVKEEIKLHCLQTTLLHLVVKKDIQWIV